MWPFKRKKQLPAPEVRPGERYVFCPDDDCPWPPKDRNPVKVLDVKDGWVRYYMGCIFSDERMRVDMFLSMYRKCDHNLPLEKV